MKKVIMKIVSILMAVVVFAGVMPLAEFEGVFKFNLVSVEAAEADPFDTSKLTVMGRGKSNGAAWTFYNNGLLWVVDDKSGETQYSGNRYGVSAIVNSSDFTWAFADIKYVYWNITAPKDCRGTFCDALLTCKPNEVKFGDTFINTSGNITDMSQMFYCTQLEKCNFGDLDTSNVTDMSWMFYGTKITELDLSKINTSKVTDMSNMFSYSDVKVIDLSGLDTSNVIDMSGMFSGCTSLESIKMDGINTGNVTDMERMFSGCKLLTSVDLSNLDTSNVKNMSQMFYQCSALRSLDVSGFDTSKVTDMSAMFYYCMTLAGLDLSSFDAGNVSSASSMFKSCYNLHMIETPFNYQLEGVNNGLTGAWYEVTKNKSVDRSVRYESLPNNKKTSITIVTELRHKCSVVSNDIGTCDECGVTVLYGDTDSDGKHSVSDAVMLKKYLAGDNTTTINLGAADVNVDLRVNVDDAVKLMKKLAGMDVKLGIAD